MFPLSEGWKLIASGREMPVLMADCILTDGVEEKALEEAAVAG